MKKTKLAMLAVLASPILFAFGCFNLSALHQIAYHISDLTQWIAATTYLTTT